jgi:protein-disulfide isomerase
MRLVLPIVLAVTACSGNADLEGKVDKLTKEVAAMRLENGELDKRIDGLAEELANARYLERKLEDLTRQQKKIADDLASRPSYPSYPSRPSRPEPDRSKTYAAPVAGAPFDGPPDAKVTMVWAYEYACPFCERARATVAELRKKYGRDLRVVYQQFVVHPRNATASAMAACAAGKQRKLARLDPLLWDKGFKARQFDTDRCWEPLGDGCPIVMGFARDAQLDVARFKRDLVPCLDEINQIKGELEKIGVRATPSFFINGRYFSGAQPIEHFVKLIDEELAKANDRIAQGASKARYYEEHVLGQGLKSLDPAPAPLGP